MAKSRLRLQPDTLWPRVVERTARALARGALRPIETEESYVEQAGVRFVVRAVSSLRRKAAERAERARAAQAADRAVNPFLPYEEDLFVADVSDRHVCLLNKHNVIAHHLLIATRAYEDQESLLNRADFEALLACMAGFDGLGFYNGGEAAGASQAHKHLQLVPLPLAREGPAVPIQPLIDALGPGGESATIPTFPFRHALARLDPMLAERPVEAARAAHERYRTLLRAAGLGTRRVAGETRQSAPYNLLLARHWMLLVPRSQELCDSLSVNALGYAGSLFVRDARQLRMVRERGPMTILRQVGLAASSAAP